MNPMLAASGMVASVLNASTLISCFVCGSMWRSIGISRRHQRSSPSDGCGPKRGTRGPAHQCSTMSGTVHNRARWVADLLIRQSTGVPKEHRPLLIGLGTWPPIAAFKIKLEPWRSSCPREVSAAARGRVPGFSRKRPLQTMRAYLCGKKKLLLLFATRTAGQGPMKSPRVCWTRSRGAISGMSQIAVAGVSEHLVDAHMATPGMATPGDRGRPTGCEMTSVILRVPL